MRAARFTTPILVAVVTALLASWPSCAAADEEVRVFAHETCVIADEPVLYDGDLQGKALAWSALIVSDIAEAMVKSVIRGIARLIQSSAAAKDFAYVAEEDLYLFEVNLDESPDLILSSRVGCVTVVSGQFSPDPPNCAVDYEPVVFRGDINDIDAIRDARRGRPVDGVLRRANICLSAPPRFVYESRVELSEDGTAFRLRGANVTVNSLLSARKPEDRRAVLKLVSIIEPSEDGRGRALASSWLQYGQLVSGVSLRESSENLVSSWTKLPGPSPAVMRSYRDDAGAHIEASRESERLSREIVRGYRQLAELEAQLDGADADVRDLLQIEINRLNTAIAVSSAALESWQEEYENLPGGRRNYMPVTLRVTVTESKSEERLLKWLGDTLEKYSGDIAEGLSESF